MSLGLVVPGALCLWGRNILQCNPPLEIMHSLPTYCVSVSYYVCKIKDGGRVNIEIESAVFKLRPRVVVCFSWWR